MNEGLERMWNETAMTYFKELSGISLERSKKAIKS
jgi:hypothetical protein